MKIIIFILRNTLSTFNKEFRFKKPKSLKTSTKITIKYTKTINAIHNLDLSTHRIISVLSSD